MNITGNRLTKLINLDSIEGDWELTVKLISSSFELPEISSDEKLSLLVTALDTAAKIRETEESIYEILKTKVVQDTDWAMQLANTLTVEGPWHGLVMAVLASYFNQQIHPMDELRLQALDDEQKSNEFYTNLLIIISIAETSAQDKLKSLVHNYFIQELTEEKLHDIFAYLALYLMTSNTSKNPDTVIAAMNLMVEVNAEKAAGILSLFYTRSLPDLSKPDAYSAIATFNKLSPVFTKLNLKLIDVLGVTKKLTELGLGKAFGALQQIYSLEDTSLRKELNSGILEIIGEFNFGQDDAEEEEFGDAYLMEMITKILANTFLECLMLISRTNPHSTVINEILGALNDLKIEDDGEDFLDIVLYQLSLSIKSLNDTNATTLPLTENLLRKIQKEAGLEEILNADALIDKYESPLDGEYDDDTDDFEDTEI